MPNRATLRSSADPRVQRHKVFLPAEMAGPDGAGRVHLLNLSRTGALIHADAPPAAGAMVHLRCGTTSWAARVVWASEKRLGVVHLTPLTPASIAGLVAGLEPA